MDTMRTRWIALTIGLVGLCGLSTAAVAEELPPTSMHAYLSPTASTPFPHAVPNPAALTELARTYTTPKAVAKFLRREFTFARDEALFGAEDRWQTPEEFLSRRTGDCEDYALLARELLRRNGIEAYVFSLIGQEGYAHTVAVYLDERGRYNVINQDRLRTYRAKSLEALASALYPGWTWGAIAEQVGTRGHSVREIVNPHPAPSADFEEIAFQF